MNARELLAESVLRLYALPHETTMRLISVSENEIYELAAPDGRRWALRLQRPGYQSMPALASEIAWLLALRHDGVMATSVPHAGVNGERVQSFLDPIAGYARAMVLFSWEDGIQPTIDMDLHACFVRLGAIIARMHQHSRAWQRPAGFTRFRWDVDTAIGESALWGRWRDGLGMTAARIDVFARVVSVIRKRLNSFGEEADRFGLAHCDLRLANMLLHEGEVRIIDFDDCGFSWYMADVANCVSFYEHLPQVPQLIGSLLEGYRTVCAVSDEEEEEIPTFLMMRRLMLVAWIGSHQEAPLAASLGTLFTEQTVALCTAYLERFG